MKSGAMWACLGCYSIPATSSMVWNQGILASRKEWHGFRSRKSLERGGNSSTIADCCPGPSVSILHVNHPLLYTFVINIAAVSFSYFIALSSKLSPQDPCLSVYPTRGGRRVACGFLFSVSTKLGNTVPKTQQ